MSSASGEICIQSEIRVSDLRQVPFYVYFQIAGAQNTQHIAKACSIQSRSVFGPDFTRQQTLRRKALVFTGTFRRIPIPCDLAAVWRTLLDRETLLLLGEHSLTM